MRRISLIWAWLDRRSEAVVLSALLTAALIVRVYRISEETLWFDEIVNWQYIHYPTLREFLVNMTFYDVTMVPAWYVLAYYQAWLADYSIPVMRLFMVLPGLGTGLFLYLLARRLYGVPAGIAALILFSFSNIHIYYSQEVRVYSQYLFLAVVSVYSLWRAVEDERRPWWVVHVVANGLLTWTHMFACLLLVAEGMFLIAVYFRHWKGLAVWFGIHTLFAISLLLWVLSLDFKKVAGTTAWLPAPEPSDIHHAVLWGAAWIPFVLYKHYAVLYSVPVLLFSVLGWRAVREWQDTRTGVQARRILLLGLWLVFPILALAVVSWLGRPAFLMRYLLHCSLALFVLIGGGVAMLPGRLLRGTVISGLLVLLLWQLMLEGRPYRPDLRAMMRSMEARETESDAVYVNASFPLFSSVFRQDRDAATLISEQSREDTPVERFSSSAEIVRAGREASASGRTVWIMVCEEGSHPDCAFSDLEEMMDGENLQYETLPVQGGSPAYMSVRVWPRLVATWRTLSVYRLDGGANSAQEKH